MSTVFGNDADDQSGWKWPDESTDVANAADADSHIDDDAIDSSRLPSLDEETAESVTEESTDAPVDEDSVYDTPSFLRRRFHRKKNEDK